MGSVQKRALISVSDKTGIEIFAKALVDKGFSIVSSGGTYRYLKAAGLEPTLVSDRTGFPEILGGRVKTLHPKIHGALLARYELDDHQAELDHHQIERIHLVVVNLYPFAKTIAKPDVSVAEAVENIDIGGPTMIRASAKNFANLTILTDPGDYQTFVDEVDEHGLPSLNFRLAMSRKAFHHTFAYDMRIADYLDGIEATEDDQLQAAPGGDLPTQIRLTARKAAPMRYGENPHQQAAFYELEGLDASTYLTQHQGKQLSYNNLVDMEAAWRCVLDFQPPTAVIVKHTNPCGVASHENLETAFRRARQVDSVSSFGGIMAFNREVDADVANAIKEQFAELVIAPKFTEAALKAFRKRKNLRVLELKRPADLGSAHPLELKRLDHGLLVQERDEKAVPFEAWQQVSERSPSEEEIAALKCAWVLVKHVKSNAIVYADADGAVGIGAGQMSRVDAAKVAIQKAGEADLSIAGTAMASDAFFPFRDSIDAAAAAGVTAVVEPGGSVRDEEVIAAANEHGITLFFTSTRHFKH